MFFFLIEPMAIHTRSAAGTESPKAFQSPQIHFHLSSTLHSSHIPIDIPKSATFVRINTPISKLYPQALAKEPSR